MTILDDPDILVQPLENQHMLGHYLALDIGPRDIFIEDVFEREWGISIEKVIQYIRDSIIIQEWKQCVQKTDDSAKKFLCKWNKRIIERVLDEYGLKYKFRQNGNECITVTKNCKILTTYKGWSFMFKSKTVRIRLSHYDKPEYNPFE